MTGIAIMVEKDAEPSSRSVSRTQRRASRTRKRLLDAALAMFSEKGVDATAIEDITERADVGKGTFYRHFGNKEAVVVALSESAVSRLIDSTKPAKPPESLEAALEHLLNAHCAFYKEHAEEFLLLFQGRLLLKLQKEAADVDPSFAGYLKELGQHVAAFAPQPVPDAKIRRLAAALAGYPFLHFALVKPSAAAEEIETVVQPLRRSIVAGLVALLSR
ncbi:MAG TPA: TetR/AcrR family transcriptional regulator [Planctomycetota bacterium]|nr:TetR/AcrR family transcriptional regulator [Planctomycetota bacterium]